MAEAKADVEGEVEVEIAVAVGQAFGAWTFIYSLRRHSTVGTSGAFPQLNAAHCYFSAQTILTNDQN